MKTLFVGVCLLVATATDIGCNTNNRVELPAEPVPMPSEGPERAGAAVPGAPR